MIAVYLKGMPLANSEKAKLCQLCDDDADIAVRLLPGQRALHFCTQHAKQLSDMIDDTIHKGERESK